MDPLSKIENDVAPAIRVRDLTRRFAENIAVDCLTFDVFPGEVFGLLGHNGAGKMTTIRLLNGVLGASAGKAQVLGFDPVRQGSALRRRTGVLTENPSLDENLTARENLTIYADLYDVPPRQVAGRVSALLDRFALADRADDKVGSYSKGMKQRLALARALLHQPALLFLDEPTSGLDPIAALEVRELIVRLSRKEGRTIVLCTHNLVEAQRLCDRVIVLERGKLLALGAPSELGSKLVGQQNCWPKLVLVCRTLLSGNRPCEIPSPFRIAQPLRASRCAGSTRHCLSAPECRSRQVIRSPARPACSCPNASG